MKIRLKDIHPDLRPMAALMRAFYPSSFSEGMLRAADRLQSRFGTGKPFGKKVKYEQIFVPRTDGSLLRLCLYMPPEGCHNAPGLLWMHGGGYALGLPEQDYAFIERFVLASGCFVVAPDYQKSTKVPYPAALHDCYQALLWLKEYGTSYGARKDQIFIGGDSAGGGLCAALSLYARDKGEVSIAFQMPLYPMIDDRMITESSIDNDAPVWNSRSNELAWKMYLGELYGTHQVPVYAAPARNSDFSDMPPTLTYVGSIEPFRDETIAYVNALKTAGTKVSFHIFKGCFHGFDIVCGKSKVARRANAFLIRGFLYATEHFYKEQP